jgi:L-ascorbate metabolism protein UlaG (beta-lactamase superfamily)
MGTLTFIGTATTLIRLGTFTLLTDPNFLHRGQRAYLGRGLWTRRLTEPSAQPSGLPPLDAILLSHLHGDHFDRVARRDLARSQPIYTTPEAQGPLTRWGFDARGLDTWEQGTMQRGNETLVITSTPGVHARGLLGKLLPPVMGIHLEHRVDDRPAHRVYISGDTLTGDHLDAIRERHPDIDTAVVHLGGTRVLFSTVTMDAEQGTDFMRRIQPRSAVPVHYDDYRVFRSPLGDFLQRAREEGFGDRVRPVTRGETIPLDSMRSV